MRIIKGAYTSAEIFTTDNEASAIDEHALAQIQMLCDNESLSGSKIRVMPDVHAGKAGPVGLTLTIGSRILPGLVGIDIGCGMTMARLKDTNVEYQKLDTVIRDRVPSGFSVRRDAHSKGILFDYGRLCCHKNIQEEKAVYSMGTLGGGNHFIELDRGEEGNLYVVIHSGSRHLGKEAAEYYMDLGRKNLRRQGILVPYELTYLEDELMEQYLHDIMIVQEYAKWNRDVILEELAKGMKWKILEVSSCIHNYVEEADGVRILRKGAISARKEEPVIIPVNMRDGVLLGKGLGNPEWNYSAPHGAGRILKRKEVRDQYTLSQFKAEMKGIYSPSIHQDTLDEAPFAYRGLEEIMSAAADTVKVDKVIHPVYNYKAGGEESGKTSSRRKGGYEKDRGRSRKKG